MVKRPPIGKNRGYVDKRKGVKKMQRVEEIISEENGVTLHYLPTEKYKTTTIAVRFKGRLSEDTVSARALIPYVLQAGCEKYETNAKIRQQLENLYGAMLSVDVSKKGEYHVISFVMDIANEQYIHNEDNVFSQGVQLLHEVIFKPLLVNRVFKQNIIETEKRMMLQRIASVEDDKVRYSSQRLVEEMCKGEPYALNANGIASVIPALNGEVIYQAYEKMLQEDQVDFYVVGSVAEERLVQIKQYFALGNRPKVVVQAETSSVREEKEIIEQQELNQGKLNLGYRTHITYSDSDYFAFQVFNGIFGGFPHSKLFVNVREKNSLAYYASSRYESHKGLMMVMSGIETQNYEKAVAIIREQMEAMRNGEFSEEEIAQTKAVMKNQILETLDTSRGLIEMMYHNALANVSIPVEEWLEKLEAVTKEEIIAIGKKVQLDTIYFLKGKEA